MNELWFRSNGPQETRFLSNFWMEKFDWEGDRVKSAEHAYQAEKAALGEDRRFILRQPRPLDAMIAGRGVLQKPDFDAHSTMWDVLCAKFALPGLRQSLLDTGDAVLIENNRGPWGGKNGGANQLGKLLMQLRAMISEDEADRAEEQTR